MALTRAQLIQGNSSQGVILNGQVQGVTSGPGLTIDPNGSIQINSQTVIGLMKLGQTPVSAAAAYNGYTWPTTAGSIGQQLATNGSGTLSWSDPDGLAWTAKGEIVVGTGVDTQTFLTVGPNGSILIADNTQVSGLAYTSNYVPTAGATTAAFLPAGTTGNRPSLTSGQAGAIRYNASTTSMELWNGTAWETIASDALTGFVPQTSPTGSAVMPAGPDGSRDVSPIAGYTRFNTTSASLEVWNGVAWTLVGAPPTGGLGINVTGSIVKVAISSSSSPPAVGGGATQAVVGSLFWNDILGQLFIYYSNGGTPAWVQAAPSATSGGSGTGTVTNVTGTAPISVATGTTTPVISLNNTAVTPGSYTAANITVDAQGRITAAANGSGGGGGTVTSIDITAGTGITSTGGPITTAGAITVGLANTAVTPGAYVSANITVDAQGRITAASNGGAGTVTTVTGTAPIAVATGTTTPVVSITPGTAGQLMQTNAGGTAAEFASNIGIPGTLDVAGVSTFASIGSFPLGTAAAPSITFTGDTNTGFYSPAANTAGITTNGVQQLQVDPNGVLSFNSGYGSVAPAYGCRAWVNFAGVPASPTIAGSGNVSSVVKTSQGSYTVNFTTAMPDANYAVTGTVNGTGATGNMFLAGNFNTPNTSSAVYVVSYRSNIGDAQDTTNGYVAIFR